MDAIVVLVLVVSLAGASLRWGFDSRPGFSPADYDDVKGRIDGLLAQARVDALIRKPGWASRAAGATGTWLVALGSRLQGYGESLVVPSRFAATSDGSIQSGL